MKFTRTDQKVWAAGLTLSGAFIPLLFLPTLRGENLHWFFLCFGLAALAYIIAIIFIRRLHISLQFIWGVAIIARLILLGTTPTLSDDGYRYLWDGHLLKQGINPYAEVVESPLLDQFDTSLRESVNHSWMASPYLPAAQGYFWLVETIAPQQIKAYQISALVFDLLTGLMVYLILLKLKLDPKAVLLYLWNPLVIVEFAHGAHLEALMMFLTMLSWLLVLNNNKEWLSVITMTLAALTKGLPIIIIPLWLRRWKAAGLIILALLSSAALTVFATGAGWGLFGELDGRGLFGAIRIYSQYWQFNAGPIYKIAELFHGKKEMIGVIVRLIAGASLVIVLAWSTIKAWRFDQSGEDPARRGRRLIRLSLLPFGAFLLLSPTVHPWYVTILIPFTPFFIPARNDRPGIIYWIIPITYFSMVVILTYLAYGLGQTADVPVWLTWVEYLPLYGLVIWSAINSRMKSETLHG